MLDHTSVHKSNKVREFLTDNPNVKLIWLPKGSSYLNMIKQCWKISKYVLVVSEYYPTFTIMPNVVSEYLRTIKFNLNIADYIFRKFQKILMNL